MWWCCGNLRQKVIDISAPQCNCGEVWTDLQGHTNIALQCSVVPIYQLLSATSHHSIRPHFKLKWISLSCDTGLQQHHNFCAGECSNATQLRHSINGPSVSYMLSSCSRWNGKKDKHSFFGIFKDWCSRFLL